MLARAWFLIFFLIFVDNVSAENRADDYQVEVVVDNALETARQAAYVTGLQTVITRLSARDLLQLHPDIEEVYAHASQYVVRYTYVTENKPENEQSFLLLQIKFNADLLNQWLTAHNMMHRYVFGVTVLSIVSSDALAAMLQQLESIDGTEAVMIREVHPERVLVWLTAWQDPSSWVLHARAAVHFFLLNSEANSLTLQWNP